MPDRDRIDDIIERLGALERRVDERHDGLGDTVNALADTVNGLKGKVNTIDIHVSDMLLEIGGAEDSRYRDPQRRSLRKRLHDLEQTTNAAHAVGAALGLLFGRITRWAMLIGIIVAAVGTLLRLFGVGGG